MTHETITLTNKLNALTSEIREVRRQVGALDAKLDRLLAATDTADTAPEGVRTLDNGRTFMPGTGTLGPRTLGAEAMAALAALDEAEPTQLLADHNARS